VGNEVGPEGVQESDNRRGRNAVSVKPTIRILIEKEEDGESPPLFLLLQS
jgi:hypothetical protein